MWGSLESRLSFNQLLLYNSNSSRILFNIVNHVCCFFVATTLGLVMGFPFRMLSSAKCTVLDFYCQIPIWYHHVLNLDIYRSISLLSLSISLLYRWQWCRYLCSICLQSGQDRHKRWQMTVAWIVCPVNSFSQMAWSYELLWQALSCFQQQVNTIWSVL